MRNTRSFELLHGRQKNPYHDSISHDALGKRNTIWTVRNSVYVPKKLLKSPYVHGGEWSDANIFQPASTFAGAVGIFGIEPLRYFI